MPKTKKSRGSKSVGTASQEKDKVADAKSRKLDIRGGARTKTKITDVKWQDAGKIKNDDGSKESPPLKGLELASKIAASRKTHVDPIHLPKAPPDKAPKQSDTQNKESRYALRSKSWRSRLRAGKERIQATKEKISKLPEIPSGNTSGIDINKDKEDARKTIAQMNADQPPAKKHNFIDNYVNKQKGIAGDIKDKELSHGLRQMAITQKAKDDPKFDIARAAKSDAQLRAPDVRDAIRKYRQVSKDVSKFSSPDHFSKKYATPEDRENLDKVNKETLSTVKSFAGVRTKAEVDAERDEDRGKRAREGDLSPSKKQYLRVPSDKALTSMDNKAKDSKNKDWYADDSVEPAKNDRGYNVSLNRESQKEFEQHMKSARDNGEYHAANLFAALAAPPARNDAQSRADSDRIDKAILDKQKKVTKERRPLTPDTINNRESRREALGHWGKLGGSDEDHAAAMRHADSMVKRAKAAKVRSDAFSVASVFKGGKQRLRDMKNWKPTVIKKEDKPN